MSDAEIPPLPEATPAAKPVPESRSEFLVTSAPHLAAGVSTRRVMFEVVLAMVPLFVFAVYMHHARAVVLTAATLAGCLLTEVLANAIRGRSQASLSDGSAVVTGVILAFSLPPSLPPYMAFIGGVVAIALAKAVFGGLGQNLFNPAMVGRAFLMVCFPAAMVTWAVPVPLQEIGVDATTMATPLYAAARNEAIPAMSDLFVGTVGGSLGETSALLALIGGLYLVMRRIADWRQPLGVLAAVAIFAAIAHRVNPAEYEGPLFHLSSGALMFGAFFIATDYVGAPITPRGRLIFGFGVGVLVMVIRVFGAYPEGVMFAILIMNALTPLIERWTTPVPFGGHVAAA
ncbi:MAG: RnfABCDGE type electron transport complex subunit D [Phycisphaerae bacterium]|nr:RnfABCDGE type electron transport complex subunit D [Phycisphaerae bacterium]